jgi:twitching motility protein PilI
VNQEQASSPIEVGVESGTLLDGGLLPPSAALTRFAPEAIESAAGDAAKVEVRYGIRVAGIGLLLDRGSGAELVSKPTFAPLPNAPEWLRGLMNLRGNLLPIVDLQQLLSGGEQAAAADAGFLVLVYGKADKAVGVSIDVPPRAVRDMQKVEQLPPLPEDLMPHVGQAYRAGEDFWIEFKHESFFDALTTNGVGRAGATHTQEELP